MRGPPPEKEGAGRPKHHHMLYSPTRSPASKGGNPRSYRAREKENAMPDGHSVASYTGIALGIFMVLILSVPLVMIPLYLKKVLKSGNLKRADASLTLIISLLIWLGFLFPAMLFLLSTLNSFGVPVFAAK